MLYLIFLFSSSVLSDIQSTRHSTSSSTSFDMPKANIQSQCNNFSKRKSSNIDVNDLSQLLNKQSKDETPIKVLVFNGKCSKTFKSTLEDCVQDCILEFPRENKFIYVPKSGQAIQVPAGSNRNSITSLREQSAGVRQSSRSSRQRNSLNQNNSLPQIGGARSSLTSNFSLPAAAIAVTTATRMRHQLVQQKFTLVENISEESTDQQTDIEHQPIIKNIESARQSKCPSVLPDESISPNYNPSRSLPLFPYYSKSSSKPNLSYRDRQKDYRLSDLVMFGPEHFAHIFNLPRNQLQSRQRNRKSKEKLTELDRIKQDLFHRYLWTKKPQVSCRIRSISTYTRSSTFVI